MVLLAIAFHYKSYTLGILSGMGLIVVAVAGLTLGYYGYKNNLTEAISIIIIAVGFYIIIVAPMEEIGYD